MKKTEDGETGVMIDLAKDVGELKAQVVELQADRDKLEQITVTQAEMEDWRQTQWQEMTTSMAQCREELAELAILSSAMLAMLAEEPSVAEDGQKAAESAQLSLKDAPPAPKRRESDPRRNPFRVPRR